MIHWTDQHSTNDSLAKGHATCTESVQTLDPETQESCVTACSHVFCRETYMDLRPQLFKCGAQT